MTQIPGEPAKSLTQHVVTQVRVQMALQDIRQSNLARRIGKTEQWLSVRLRGKQSIDLNDLELIAKGLGLSAADLLPSRAGAGAADTLRNLASAEKPSSGADSLRNLGVAEKTRADGPARPPKSPKRSSTRPAGTTPKHGTRRPAMLPRPATA